MGKTFSADLPVTPVGRDVVLVFRTRGAGVSLRRHLLAFIFSLLEERENMAGRGEISRSHFVFSIKKNLPVFLIDTKVIYNHVFFLC